MTHSLADFEQRRQAIAQQVAQLGDLRAGSITSTSGRCGKPGCRCHLPGQPVHGPNLRLTYKVDGKTVSESLPTPAAIHKAEREVAEFRKFRQLCREFVKTNAEICQLRPTEEERQTDQIDIGRPSPAFPVTPPDMRVRIRRFGGLSYRPPASFGIPSESK